MPRLTWKEGASSKRDSSGLRLTPVGVPVLPLVSRVSWVLHLAAMSHRYSSCMMWQGTLTATRGSSITEGGRDGCCISVTPHYSSVLHKVTLHKSVQEPFMGTLFRAPDCLALTICEVALRSQNNRVWLIMTAFMHHF